MSRTSSRDTSLDPLRIQPIGGDGLELFADPALLGPGFLTRAENIRMAKGTVDRRGGALKLWQATDAAGSITFGTDAKYATVPAASQLVIPAGGWALLIHFTAVRGAGTTYILSSRPNGQAYHAIAITLTNAGVPSVFWRDSGGSTRTVTGSAVSDGATCHLLAIFDAVAGTFTVYINGESVGTPLTGLSATLKPLQTAGVIWAFGIEKESSAAVTTGTGFLGKIDSATLFTLRGTRPASGTTTLASVLRKHSLRDWPNPAMDGVLFHYTFDSTSSLTDHSRFKNHGTVAGSPSATAAVALSSLCGHTAHVLQSPDGRRTNVVAAQGALWYEEVRGAVT